MILIEKIIKEAINKNASDIHLVNNSKPIFRIRKYLQEMENSQELDETFLYEIYDYILKGNVELNNEFVQKRKLDISTDFENVRLRINCSYSNNLPVFTIRIIENTIQNIVSSIFTWSFRIRFIIKRNVRTATTIRTILKVRLIFCLSS